MSGVTKKLISASGGVAGGGQIDISDFFSTYLYTGNSSTQTITNGVDLAGEGGLVWVKNRNSSVSHFLVDTERGENRNLKSDQTAAENFNPSINQTFNSNGFSFNNGFTDVNASSINYASWTFRKAPRFFDVVTYTGDGVAGRQIPHNLGVVPGCVIAKRIDSTGKWGVYHRSLSNDANGVESMSMFLNSSSGQGGYGFLDTHANQTSTHFQTRRGSAGSWNINGATYVAYLFAHDPLGPSGDGSDGLIACGSYTGTGAVGNFVDLGFEPQFVIRKSATGESDWLLQDSMRSMSYSDYAWVFPNNSFAESGGALDGGTLAAAPTGFIVNNAGSGNTAGQTFIYIAIRRGPMRAPTSGTEVFAIDTANSTSSAPPVWSSGFPVDMAFYNVVSGGDKAVLSRMTGGQYMAFNTNAAEAFDNNGWDFMDGWYDDTFTNSNFYSWMFRRAPEFFDVVAYTGNGTAGRTVPHNLGVAPEMMIVKKRNANKDWIVYADGLETSSLTASNYHVHINQDFSSSQTNVWHRTQPTSSEFYLGSGDEVNGSGNTYIAYLFATLAGVSKVGSYTGNGTSQTINCGFTTGARFILIKRTDSTGDWYVWDTARGIVAGNDPHLSLNSTAAEVTTDDSVDPVSSGFIVNQVAATNINVSAASYIFYAVA